MAFFRFLKRNWKWLTVVVVGLVLVGTIASLRAFKPHGEAPTVELADATELSFGLQREPLTRTVVVDPCRITPTPPACDDGEVAALEETYVLRDFTTAQCADLVRAENVRRAPVERRTVPDFTSDGQFPAQQIAVSGTSVGRGVKLTISATPDKQEKVPPGTYCGQVVVQHTTKTSDTSTAEVAPAAAVAQASEEFRWNVVIRLQDRDSFGNLLSVLLWLAAGGALGMIVRAVNSELVPSVPLWRRYRRLRAWHDVQPDTRPRWFSDELETVRTAIRQRDTEVATSHLAVLEAQQQRLEGPHGALLDEASEIINDLRNRGIDGLSTALLDLVAGRVDRIRNRCDAPDESNLQALRNWVTLIAGAEVAVTQYQANPQANQLALVNGQLRALIDQAPPPAPTRAAMITRSHAVANTTRPRIDGTKPFEFALNRSWWIGTILSVVIVIGAGLKTQYLDAPGFTDALGSWFALGLFGFAVQVSTASLVEAAGRLAPSSRT